MTIQPIEYNTTSTWGDEGKKINDNFEFLNKQNSDIYSFGAIGTIGAGVSVCPDDKLPSGLTLLPLGAIKGSDQYGNYIHLNTGSICVCIGKFYYRYNNVGNPTYSRYAPNDIDIRGVDIFPTTALANAAGYRLHRMFIDGGVEKDYVFIDKYKSSKVALGTGFAAASIKNGLPLSSALDHNPVGNLTACAGVNANHSFLKASKGRDSINGEFNQASPWFCMSVFIADGLSKIAQAQAQASTSTAVCAWFDPAGVSNFPKGCNNNALKDTNDLLVVYQSDGYSNCGRTGSGSNFAKTTHNGQNCGIADINGLMWEVLIGYTCIGVTKNITGVSKTNPCQVIAPAHGLATGQTIHIESLVGPTVLNSSLYTVTVVDSDTISLDGVDGTSLVTWVSGGAIYSGQMYLAKQSVQMQDFTNGNTLSTDHWGISGVTSMMLPIEHQFPVVLGGIPRALKVGNGTNQVFSQSDICDAGIPLASGLSSVGTALFGNDYYELYFRNEMCFIGFGGWGSGGVSGVAARYLFNSRTGSSSTSAGRSACYSA